MSEVVGLLGTLNVFDPKLSDFTVFKERLKQFFIANKISDEEQKRAILLNTLSESCYILVRNLCVPVLPENKKYEELIKLLTEHFSPVKSHFAERLKFYSAKRELNESVSDWEARVKCLASNCKFNDELSVLMRDIFVIGINDERLMDKLFEADASSATVTLQTVVKSALAKESALKEHSARGSLGIGQLNIKTESDLNFHRHRPNSTKLRGKTGNTAKSTFDLLLPSTKDIVQSKQRYQQEYHSNKIDIFFKLNDKVWVRDYRAHSQKWCTGTIHKVLGRRTYLIKTDCGKIWKRHKNQLKLNKTIVEAQQRVKPSVSYVPRSELDEIIVSSLDSEVGENSGSEVDIEGEETGQVDKDNVSRLLRRRSNIKQPERLGY